MAKVFMASVIMANVTEPGWDFRDDCAEFV